MNELKSYRKMSAGEIPVRRQLYCNMSQSSSERASVLFANDLRDFSESDNFDEDPNFRYSSELRRTRQDNQRFDTTRSEPESINGSFLTVLNKLGLLMDLLSRMPLPPASAGGIAGATLLVTFLGPRALVQSVIYPIYRHGLGALYPAYSSYKAVRSKNVREYVKWMMYWIVFAIFSCLEAPADVFVSWMPFYYEVKVLMVLWLLSPTTKGSSIIYKRFLHPALIRREQEIDDAISRARDRGYHTVLKLGSKSVNYAASVIVQTALKSSGSLMHQLRKTHSLSAILETDMLHWPAVKLNENDNIVEESVLNESNCKSMEVLTMTRGNEDQRRRPASYSEVVNQRRIEEVDDLALRLSRERTDENISSSGYPSSTFSESGITKIGGDFYRSNKTPATITEDYELFVASPDGVLAYQPYHTSTSTFPNNDLTTSTSHRYKNVMISDITDEAPTSLNTIMGDIRDATGKLLRKPVSTEDIASSKNSEIEEQHETISIRKFLENTDITSDVDILKIKNKDTKSLKRKDTFDDEIFFDTTNDSTDLLFNECENIISGNISIKITKDTTSMEDDRILSLDKLAENVNFRHCSLTPSTNSSVSNESVENNPNTNLRISPDRKLHHVLGKRKAPKPPAKSEVSATDDGKKGRGSPSVMSRLMYLPGKILPFLGKTNEKNARPHDKHTEMNVNLHKSDAAIDVSYRLLNATNSEDCKRPQLPTETNV